MKRVIASLFGTVVGLVLLFSFKTQAQFTGAVPATVTTTGDNTGTGATNTSGGSSSGNGSSNTGSSTSGTFTGDTVNTQWGPVQVQIKVTNGKVTSATAVVYPSGNSRDQQINAYAVPTLNKEAATAGNAQIDTVSGATVTSNGYIGSLQSAIDKAGL